MIPFSHQEEDARWLAGRRRALLLNAPGTGKTLTAILAADYADVPRMDTVAPASVVTQWRRSHTALSRELRPFGSHSYEAARDKGLPMRMGALALDEIHYLKNGGSRRTLRLLGTQSYGGDGHIARAKHVWGMSGTLMPKDPLDLYPVLLAVVPGALWMPRTKKTMDYYQYSRTFCEIYDHPTYGPMVRKVKNLDELAERIAPYIRRRTRKDVDPSWKEPLISHLSLDPGDAADKLRKIEGEPEMRMIADAFKKGGFAALAHVAEYGATLRRYIGLLKVIPISEWLCDQFDDGMDKIVVVCYHREVIEGLAAKLGEHKIASQIYWGGMTESQKDKAKTRFIQDGKCKGFIMQIGAGGTGLDGLQRATGRMLFAEWSWIDDENKQAIGRVDRIGQEEPVLAEFAGLEGSLDGAISAAASRRAAQNRALFN